eukprot:3666875-Ditylum_brightwellii.AAC.1
MIQETSSNGFQDANPVDIAEKMMKEVDIDEFVQLMKNSISEERRGEEIGTNTILGYRQRMSQLAKMYLWCIKKARRKCSRQ